MATNNAINLKNAGIVSYDGAGNFSALSNPLPVSNGGTSVSSTTPYGLIFGGTTSTSPVQSIAALGSSTNVLTSNGPGALATMQAAPAIFGSVIFLQTSIGNPADSATYFLAQAISLITNTTSNGSTRFVIPTTGTITACYGAFTVQGSLATSETSTLAIRLNNTTDTNVTTSLLFNATSNAVSNSSLSISVTAGDFIELKLICPVWATNPLTVSASISILIK